MITADQVTCYGLERALRECGMPEAAADTIACHLYRYWNCPGFPTAAEWVQLAATYAPVSVGAIEKALTMETKGGN
jgi:hypothetical protein